MKEVFENWRNFVSESQIESDSGDIDEGLASKVKAFFSGWTDAEAIKTLKLLQPLRGSVQTSLHSIEKSNKFLPRVQKMENTKLRDLLLAKTKSLRTIGKALDFLLSQSTGAPSSELKEIKLSEENITVEERKKIRKAFLKVYQFLKKNLTGKAESLNEQSMELSESDIEAIQIYEHVFASVAKNIQQTLSSIGSSSKNTLIKRISDSLQKEAESMLAIQALFQKVMSDKKYSVQTRMGQIFRDARKKKTEDLSDEEVNRLIEKVKKEALEKQLSGVFELESPQDWKVIDKAMSGQTNFTDPELQVLSKISKSPVSPKLVKSAVSKVLQVKKSVMAQLLNDYNEEAIKYAKIKNPPALKV